MATVYNPNNRRQCKYIITKSRHLPISKLPKQCERDGLSDASPFCIHHVMKVTRENRIFLEATLL